MRHVENAHGCWVPAPPADVADVFSRLGRDGDELWPGDRWPKMVLDGEPAPGVLGHHGPVRYVVTEVEPGRRLQFRFLAPPGFVGCHGFTVRAQDGGSRIEHRIDMDLRGWARILWPVVLGPLHDALAEDAITRAITLWGGRRDAGRRERWSPWVRCLRALGVLQRPRRRLDPAP